MTRSRRGRTDRRAADLVAQLMDAHGWSPLEVERRSLPAGDPTRQVSQRTIYRVINDAHVPSRSSRFEIAQTFGLTSNHIWGSAPLPEELKELGVIA
jgi:hypothetical protein